MSEPTDGPAENSEPQTPHSERDIAAELRLRPDPPRVMLLSRKAMVVIVTVGGLRLGAILIVALQDRDTIDGPAELYSTDRIQQADGLSNLPRDYAGIPQLGPPLPGDLGRPILSARERGLPVSAPSVAGPTGPAADPDEQLRLQEMEAARLSRLFAEATTATGRDGAVPGSIFVANRRFCFSDRACSSWTARCHRPA